MDENRERHGWHFGHWAGLALALYLIPFVVFMIDEHVLKGNLWGALGLETQSALQVVYWPVEELFDLLWPD